MRTKPALPFETWLQVKFTGNEIAREELGDRVEYADYILMTWQEPKKWLLDRFSLEQIGEALGSESHIYMDKRLSREFRNRAWRALDTLFTEVFEPHVEDVLGHISERALQTDRLNGTCYMWWDVSPYSPRYRDPEPIDTEFFLALCEKWLKSPRVALQEAAIHGLGESIGWDGSFQAAEALLADFASNPAVARRELVRYAITAMTGRIQ